MVFLPHWPQLIGSKPIDLGLERVLDLLDKLGNPHKKLPPVIHVAGTNGKGSTIAFLSSIFKAAGLKAHIYTSPHLVNFNERIVINYEQISDEYLYELSEECRIVAENNNIKVTFFEGTTALAFLAFMRNPADVILLETGLGGRLDATNVIEKPALTIITSISLDHTEYLGPNEALIAREKAGIMKKDVPCVTSLQTEEVDFVLQQEAGRINCPLYSYSYDWHSAEEKKKLVYYDSIKEQKNIYPLPSLMGLHQIINSGNAIAAVKLLKNFNISDDHICQGLTSTNWPGRLQKITKGRIISLLPKLPKKSAWEIWLDGAHNEAGAYVLSQNLLTLTKKPIYMIFGMTKGRDTEKFLSHFKNIVKMVVGVLIKTEPSAYSAEQICSSAKNLNFVTYKAESIDDAILHITKNAKEPGIILFAGSLYLASDVLKTGAF